MGKRSHKKSKKNKKSSKRKYSESSSTSEDEWVEAESLSKPIKNSSDESPDRKRKSKKKHKREYSSSSSSDASADERRGDSLKPRDNEIKKARDEWMDLPTNFSSFSSQARKKQREQEKEDKKISEQYNPSQCSRELNPYWKNGGDGLPKFQKPKADSSDDESHRYKSKSNYGKPQPGWRKGTNKASSCKSSESTSKQNEPKSTEKQETFVNSASTDMPMTDKELNLLAGKLVKAEIMGNTKLIKELQEKLEIGRKSLAESKLQDKEILLTETDRQGHSRPVTLQGDYQEASSSKKQRKKATETHKDKERVRYFPDDDKYSLKDMFENEKFNSGDKQDSEFVKLASNIRKNDDLDDLFADNIRRKKSDSKIDDANRSKAISEHKKMSDSLDNCSRCIQSASMKKHLIISMGEYVCLSLPAHEPLLEGHCLIAPIRHVSSVTQLDENEWSEIKDFRKALVRLFASKEEEPVFFEIATGFHRYPHMVLECVPLPKEDSETAPIYFKKAIDECETEWAQNKKLVSLKGRDVRKAIPKELPYFSVSFGLEEGFAHVIEEEAMFPKNFAQEIIGGILDLHHSKWRKPVLQSFDMQSKRVLNFSNSWKDFDCTV